MEDVASDEDYRNIAEPPKRRAREFAHAWPFLDSATCGSRDHGMGLPCFICPQTGGGNRCSLWPSASRKAVNVGTLLSGPREQRCSSSVFGLKCKGHRRGTAGQQVQDRRTLRGGRGARRSEEDCRGTASQVTSVDFHKSKQPYIILNMSIECFSPND